MPGYLRESDRYGAPAQTPTRGLIPTPYTVRRRHRETGDIVTLEMAAADGGGLPGFIPGQFNMLYVFGVGEVPISISGDPLREQALVHTVRAVGSVTRRVFGLRRGDQLGVRGPFGSGWPVAETADRDIVVIAGGIGLAPLRPLVYHLLRRHRHRGELALLYGARSPDELVFCRDLHRWQNRNDIQVAVTVDAAYRGWNGHVGVVTRLIGQLNVHAPEALAMVCGPEIMMRFALWELLQRGFEPSNIHLSLERHMQCGIGICGHCQFGPELVCRDGPVFAYPRIAPWFLEREV